MLNRLTPIVKNLMIINGIVFVANNLFAMSGKMEWIWKIMHLHKTFIIIKPNAFVGAPDHVEFISEFIPVQIVTHFFSHMDLMHLAFNMLVLFFAGTAIERLFGPKRFLIYYLFCGVIGGILLALFDPSPYPVLGASGAIAGVLVAFAVYYPDQRISLFFIPVGIKARDFALGYATISGILIILQYFKVMGDDGISHFGHLAGMIAGFVYLLIEKYIPALRN